MSGSNFQLPDGTKLAKYAICEIIAGVRAGRAAVNGGVQAAACMPDGLRDRCAAVPPRRVPVAGPQAQAHPARGRRGRARGLAGRHPQQLPAAHHHVPRAPRRPARRCVLVVLVSACPLPRLFVTTNTSLCNNLCSNSRCVCVCLAAYRRPAVSCTRAPGQHCWV